MNSQRRHQGTMLTIACAMACFATSGAAADDPTSAATTPVQAVWKAEQVRYSYAAFTTAYACDSYEHKVEEILRTLGAHPNTRVRTSGCQINRPSRSIMVTLDAVVPVVQGSAMPSQNATQALAERVGKNQEKISPDPFPAQWKSVELGSERRLRLEPGDCELLEGLSKQVLPKLGMKIEDERLSCTPRQLSAARPELKVSALVALPKADDAKP